jgi:hypothetical protein
MASNPETWTVRIELQVEVDDVDALVAANPWPDPGLDYPGNVQVALQALFGPDRTAWPAGTRKPTGRPYGSVEAFRN